MEGPPHIVTDRAGTDMGLPPPSSEGGKLCPGHPSAQHTHQICGFYIFHLDL